MTNSTTNDTVARETITPIWISHRTRQRLVTAALAVVVLLLWHAPTLLVLTVGGGSLALVLSFPVRRLTRVMPRGAAIALSLLLVTALVAFAIALVVPIILDQLAAFAAATPEIAQRLEVRVPRELAERLLGDLGRIVNGAAGVVGTLIGIAFVAAYLLVDARRIQAAMLGATPHRYRRDVRGLSDAFTHTLSRYLGGLVACVLTEGALAAIAFHVLGIKYALLLGAWVSLMALVPYMGAVVGYAPAVLLAFAVSPERGLLAAPLSLLINLLESNVLSPRIQGDAVQVPPFLVFLTAVAGGELFGVGGIVFATPALAMMRVLFDFLQARIRVEDDGPSARLIIAETVRQPTRNPSVNDLRPRPS